MVSYCWQLLLSSFIVNLTLKKQQNVSICMAAPWLVQSNRGGSHASQMTYDAIRNQVVITGNVYDSQLFANFQQLSSVGLEQELQLDPEPDDDYFARSQPKDLLLAPNKSIRSNNSTASSCFVATIGNSLHYGGHHQQREITQSPINVQSTSILLLESSSAPVRTNVRSEASQVVPPTSAIVVGFRRLQQNHDNNNGNGSKEVGGPHIVPQGVEQVVMTIPLDTDGSSLHYPEPVVSTFPMRGRSPKPLFSFPIAAIPDRSPSSMFMAVHESETVPRSISETKKFQISNEDLLLDMFGLSSSISGTPAIQKLNPQKETLEWFTPIIDGENIDENHRTILSSLAVASDRDDILLVAGSTTSKKRSTFGSYLSSSVDWDGFVTKVNSSTGQMLDTFDDESSSSPTKNSFQIRTQPGHDEFIHAICTQQETVIVVGTTDGVMDESLQNDDGTRAFVIKIDVATMELVWKYQFPGMGVKGLACAVGHDEGNPFVYIGGQVSEGMNLMDVGTNHGYNSRNNENSDDDDIFVAKITSYNATVLWTRQFGSSSRHDTLKSLVTDEDDNALVFGNSMKIKAQQIEQNQHSQNDIFIMSLDKRNGNHPVLFEDGHGEGNNSENDFNEDDYDDDDNMEDGGVTMYYKAAVALLVFSTILCLALIGLLCQQECIKMLRVRRRKKRRYDEWKHRTGIFEAIEPKTWDGGSDPVVIFFRNLEYDKFIASLHQSCGISGTSILTTRTTTSTTTIATATPSTIEDNNPDEEEIIFYYPGRKKQSTTNVTST